LQEKFRVALCQLAIKEQKEENLFRAHEMIVQAASLGAKVVVLPEMFNCPYQTRLFPRYAEIYPDGPSIKMLASTAREQQVYIVGGSIPEQEDNNLYNTSFVFGPDGKLLGRHRKVHLFDVDLPGGIKVLESSVLSRGNQSTVIHTGLCSIGVAVCYDIRFPELFRLMVLKGAQLVVVPAAFNMTTGPVHWETTFRLRAVDNQVYTIGASCARDWSAGYVAYGHSLICDPWGEILAKAGEGEEIICAEINLERLEKIRRELPLLKHRRTDLY